MFLLKFGSNLERAVSSCRQSTALSICLLVLPELFPVKLLTLCWNVHPKATLSAYRARAVDLESDAVVRDGRRWEVDVGWVAVDVGAAIVMERKQVNDIVVDLLGRHRRSELHKGISMGQPY